jgi:hypothetical protein
LQDYASAFGLNELTEFSTSVERVTEISEDGGWRVLTKTTSQEKLDGRDVIKVTWKEKVRCYTNLCMICDLQIYDPKF